jgi:hypothetical protein
LSKAFIDPHNFFLRRRSAAFISLVTSFAGVVALSSFLENIKVEGVWYFMLFYSALSIPAGFLAAMLNKKVDPNK